MPSRSWIILKTLYGQVVKMHLKTYPLVGTFTEEKNLLWG